MHNERDIGIYDDELGMMDAARVMEKQTKSAVSYLSRRGIKVGVDYEGNEIRVVLQAGVRGRRWYTRRKWIAEFELAVNEGKVKASERRAVRRSPRKPSLPSHAESVQRFKR